jgi:hypothetical protein
MGKKITECTNDELFKELAHAYEILNISNDPKWTLYVSEREVLLHNRNIDLLTNPFVAAQCSVCLWKGYVHKSKLAINKHPHDDKNDDACYHGWYLPRKIN